LDGWLRFEVDERAQRYGQVHRPGRDHYPPIDVPEPDSSPRATAPALVLAREDVTACA
jgi:hypothetical protein